MRSTTWRLALVLTVPVALGAALSAPARTSDRPVRATTPADVRALLKPGADEALRLPASTRALASPARSGAGEPALAVSPDGAVWLSWFEAQRGGGHAFRAARLEGGRWTSPFTIATGDSFFVNWADVPTLLPLGPGHLVAHWPWKSGEGTYAYDVRVAQSFDGGSTWGAPLVPHRDGTATEHGFVSMAPDGGGARLVWLDGRNFAAAPQASGHDDAHGHGGAEMTLRTALLTREGTLDDERVLDARVCDCCPTAIVRAASGLIVAYRDRDSAEVRDISIVRNDRRGWSEPDALSRDGWTVPGCPVNGPSLDARGNLVAAAWYTGAGESPQVLVSFSVDGGRTFEEPVQVDEGAPLGRVDLALLEDGAAVVTWVEGTAKSARILARRVRADGRIGPASIWARTSGTRASGIPRLVRAGDTLVLAWTEARKPSRLRTATVSLGR